MTYNVFGGTLNLAQLNSTLVRVLSLHALLRVITDCSDWLVKCQRLGKTRNVEPNWLNFRQQTARSVIL